MPPIAWISLAIVLAEYGFRLFPSTRLEWYHVACLFIWYTGLTNFFILILIVVQRDGTQSSLFIILQIHSKCFGCQPHPSSGETQNCNYNLRYWCSYLPPTWPTWPTWPRWREVAAPVSEAVVTVLCTPDDGCGWHPKHIEWTCRIINRLLCVASRWTIINIDQRCTEP